MARMQRYFGLEEDSLPSEPIVQDDSNYLRKMTGVVFRRVGFLKESTMLWLLISWFFVLCVNVFVVFTIFHMT